MFALGPIADDAIAGRPWKSARELDLATPIREGSAFGWKAPQRVTSVKAATSNWTATPPSEYGWRVVRHHFFVGSQSSTGLPSGS